jgi:hypothetical protein
MDGRTLDAVYGFGQYPGCRGFACTARTDKKVCVGQALLLYRILQCPNNMILA